LPAAPQNEPIDVGRMASAPTLNLPQTTIPQVPNSAAIALHDLPAIANTAAQDQLDSEAGDLTKTVTDATPKLGTKAAKKAEPETTAGVPALNQQFKEINDQIRQIQSDAFAATQKSEDRLAPTFAIRGEQAQIERQRAVRV